MPPEPIKKGPIPVAAAPAERRKNVRYPFNATAIVIDVQSETKLAGRCSDLGRGGCFVDTISPFPIGTVVRLQLTLEQKSFEAQAKVAYSLDGMGMGLSFTAAAPEQFRVLEKWIGVLSGETPPELAVRAPEPPPQSRAPVEPASDQEPRYVLNELILALMRNRVLGEAEGRALLKKLLS